jgi:fructose-1,6-bisphosphatase I
MLCLPNDGEVTGPLLEDLLPAGAGPGRIIAALARATLLLADRLAAGTLYGDPAALVGVNDSGDAQKALDVGAHDHMMAALSDCGVRQVLSEEAADLVLLDPAGAWDVAIDPIDGSGSIGIGAPLGMLFSILPASPAGFLRPGRAVVAAGYASFGHATDFGWSCGDGVRIATLDRVGCQYRVTRTDVALPRQARTIAYNASNERHWPSGLQDRARDLRAGKDGPRGHDVNMRWLAAAVGELHRILLQGGAFLYPADRRTGYGQGRLRLIYEAAPIAFLIEQAGGRATDGIRDILDLHPTGLHQNTPLVFGAGDEVTLIARHLANGASG